MFKNLTGHRFFIAILGTLLIILFCGTFFSGSSFGVLSTVEAAEESYIVALAKTDQTYEAVTANIADYATAYQQFSNATDINTVILYKTDTDNNLLNDKVIAMKEGRGIAVTQSSNSTLTFTSTYPGGTQTYVANNYVAYYQSTNSSKLVTLTISGYTGTTWAGNVILIPTAHIYSDVGLEGYANNSTAPNSDQYEFDYYTKNSYGNLVHYISRYKLSSTGDYYCTYFVSIVLDKAPDFMSVGVRYYSTDGLTYYSTPHEAASGENPIGTYAIYYKLLSYRTETNYTITDLNAFIAYKNETYTYSPYPNNECAYLNEGDAFINYGDIYGINAAMEIAFANHESAYGKSYFAVDRYNFFGVGAVDSNPDGAYAYTDAEDGIRQHVKYWMSRYYIDAYAYIDETLGTAYYDVPDKTAGYIASYSGDSRYFGSCPGNKLIGINVKYASDPFHGEVVASKMYEIDRYLGNKDYDNYSIGVTKKVTYAYAQPDDTSWKLYKYTSKDPNRDADSISSVPIGMSVTILGQSGDYYIIVSEMAIDENGKACYTFDTTNRDNLSFVAYVKKTDITLVRDNLDKQIDLTSSEFVINKSNSTISNIATDTTIATFLEHFENGSVQVYFGEDPVTDGVMKTGLTVKIYDAEGTYVESFTSVVTGDVNGDGVISITDLVLINRDLLGKSLLSGAYYEAADTNDDGTVSITDLVLVNRHLLEKSVIIPN